MSAKYIRAKIDSMAKTPGVKGCAVVEIAAGMVWHAAGSLNDFVAMAEAASDYWRLHLRMQSLFGGFGALDTCTLTYASDSVMLTDCGNDMVFVTVCETPALVHLPEWRNRIQQLRLILEAQ
jgi:predicted regulator of Ras-like GTPase activity (Roadblock/LC7/MglB family)